jgi:hypothetical protein
MTGLILSRAIGVGCFKRYRLSPLEDMLLSPLPIVQQFIVASISPGDGKRPVLVLGPEAVFGGRPWRSASRIRLPFSSTSWWLYVTAAGLHTAHFVERATI